MALIPNIFKATSMNLHFVSTGAKLRLLDSKHSWASRPTKTPFRCEFYLNLHQVDKHMRDFMARLLDAEPQPSAAETIYDGIASLLESRGDSFLALKAEIVALIDSRMPTGPPVA